MEKERIPPIDLPSYCNDFLTSRVDGTNELILRRVDQIDKEIVTIRTSFSPWDSLIPPEEFEKSQNQDPEEEQEEEDEEDLDVSLIEDQEFQFEITITKEGHPKNLMFNCLGVKQDVDVFGLAVMPVDEGTPQEEESRYVEIPRSLLSEETMDNIVDFLVERGLDQDLIHHIIDYRIRDEATEYDKYLARAIDFLKK
eukprot:CAMPEP_0185266442 /NCGR_PEP_ID=MMETSP1359-20130426/31122_1 /TAXON_ID=552665 /ORGANISM="Bigelowiella longifila, Strain CCMP242" /LENGTH=196 /DNA_ID=CAMNT_0027856263 /DNA_START=96 /DNA_END=686 /DNA_ORIENTATION=+